LPINRGDSLYGGGLVVHPVELFPIAVQSLAVLLVVLRHNILAINNMLGRVLGLVVVGVCKDGFLLHKESRS